MSHAEKDALIAALFDLLGRHERRLSELESQVKKTSRNSSQPPSMDGYWLVGDAMRMIEVPIPVISQAVMQLFSSRDERKNWARAIAMMRHGFGGHVYGADAATRQERREGRVGDIYRGDE
jgi:6-phosphogluconate dehydrogenase (decarboxylating)